MRKIILMVLFDVWKSAVMCMGCQLQEIFKENRISAPNEPTGQASRSQVIHRTNSTTDPPDGIEQLELARGRRATPDLARCGGTLRQPYDRAPGAGLRISPVPHGDAVDESHADDVRRRGSSSEEFVESTVHPPMTIIATRTLSSVSMTTSARRLYSRMLMCR